MDAVRVNDLPATRGRPDRNVIGRWIYFLAAAAAPAPAAPAAPAAAAASFFGTLNRAMRSFSLSPWNENLPSDSAALRARQPIRHDTTRHETTSSIRMPRPSTRTTAPRTSPRATLT